MRFFADTYLIYNRENCITKNLQPWPKAVFCTVCKYFSKTRLPQHLKSDFASKFPFPGDTRNILWQRVATGRQIGRRGLGQRQFFLLWIYRLCWTVTIDSCIKYSQPCAHSVYKQGLVWFLLSAVGAQHSSNRGRDPTHTKQMNHSFHAFSLCSRLKSVLSLAFTPRVFCLTQLHDDDKWPKCIILC